MWNRKELKSRAREVLKGNYWYALAASILILLVQGSTGGGGGGGSAASKGESWEWLTPAMVGLMVLGVIALILLRIFIGYALEVGGRKFFIRLSGGEREMAHLGAFFKVEAFGSVWRSMLRRGIYLFFWTLLLIIPGIIKYYAYRMVPYILAENPRIGSRRAIELSRQMTDGEKFDIFILDLSFIGWYLLGLLAFGIGIIFVQPYVDATHAELYLALRARAIEKGFTSEGELH